MSDPCLPAMGIILGGDRSGTIEGLNPPFLTAAAGGKCSTARTPFLARGRATALVVRPAGPWLEMSVTDDGQGVPSTEVEQLFFAERQPVHANPVRVAILGSRGKSVK